MSAIAETLPMLQARVMHGEASVTVERDVSLSTDDTTVGLALRIGGAVFGGSYNDGVYLEVPAATLPSLVAALTDAVTMARRAGVL